jgi:hypothetical protein
MAFPTPAKLFLVNAILNAYVSKRPAKPQRLYNMKTIFETVSRASAFPVTIPFPPASRFASHMVLTSMSACLPGGRGCVGKERMGTVMTNRQVAKHNHTGIHYSPIHDNVNTSYGFLQLHGQIHFHNGTTNNISIPVEGSGLIGLRTGMSTQLLITPNMPNIDDMLHQFISELEFMLFRFLRFEKTRPYKIQMINSGFRMFPNTHKIQNFKEFTKFLYTSSAAEVPRVNGRPPPPPPMKDLYSPSPNNWLFAQGRPSIIKAVYKPVRKHSDVATVTISPNGYAEIMGSMSMNQVLNSYIVLTEAFERVKPRIRYVLQQEKAVPKPVNAEKKKKKNKLLEDALASSIPMTNANVVYNKNGSVKIFGKSCLMYKKPVLVEWARRLEVSTIGTKETLCKRIHQAIHTKT